MKRLQILIYIFSIMSCSSVPKGYMLNGEIYDLNRFIEVLILKKQNQKFYTCRYESNIYNEVVDNLEIISTGKYRISNDTLSLAATYGNLTDHKFLITMSNDEQALFWLPMKVFNLKGEETGHFVNAVNPNLKRLSKKIAKMIDYEANRIRLLPD